MANLSDRHPENVAGSWYVDTSCISCGLCGEYAASSFKSSADGSQHIVYHQPVGDAELTAADDAKENCPVDAIGNNG